MLSKKKIKILLAPNSYKECIGSDAIVDIIKNSLSENTRINIISVPLSDGGDGFLHVCKYHFNLKDISYLIKENYLDELSKNVALYDDSSKTVFLEAAELFGLKKLNLSDRNPLRLNTKPLGAILKLLSQYKIEKEIDIKRIVIGIGGTATIDFGIGACSQLGLDLFNRVNLRLEPYPGNFSEANAISFNPIKLPFKISCIVDVNTELIGEPGAIEIYGKQKGANSIDLRKIKDGIINILYLIERDLDLSIPEKLNGAGGGLAAGLNLFFDAKIIPAKTFIINEILKGVDLDAIDVVITGEGSFDFQSYEGKGTGVIIDLFKDKKTKIILINGSTNLPNNVTLPQNVTIINLQDFFDSKEESMKNTETGILKAVEIIKDWFGL